MSQAKQPPATTAVGKIQADNGKLYPDDVYHETSRATGNQQEVADMWADGALPTHSTTNNCVKLYTSTENFVGYQYPSGRGKLKHYAHIQAIRTYSGLIIGDSSCYGRGWAHCSYPNDQDYYFDLTTLKAQLKGEEESIYEIAEISGDEATFESGRIYNLAEKKWVGQASTGPDNPILGI